MRFFLFFFQDDFYFRAVLGLQKHWEGGTEISHGLLAPTHAQPPTLSASLITHQNVCFFFFLNQG